METAPSDVEMLIAARVRAIRAAGGFTLDDLAARSGVSRAMLSRIERGESSPTAGLLVKLCNGLGVTLAALLGGDDGAAPRGAWALARRADQPVWRDPGSGYLRRVVSPASTDSRVEIAEVQMPVGASVLLDPLHRAGHDQHLWVLDGTVEIVRGGDVVVLDRGDCLRLLFEGPTGFRNAGPGVARYAVITGRAAREGNRHERQQDRRQERG